jgi:glucose-fructose oxidoreductase
MSRRFRVGVVGFAHMHVNELVERLAATGRCDFVAVADTVPATPSLTEVEGSRRANLVRALGAPGGARHLADWRGVVGEKPDILVFCPEISRHAEVAEAAAAAGIHLLTEKPLAGTLADADRMIAAAGKAGVALVTNWPITWRPAVRRAKDIIDSGEIGAVVQFRWRNMASLGPLAHGSSHPGATTIGLVSEAEKASEWWHQKSAGGGALLDYCCYGACLAAWMVGMPVEVRAMATNLMSPGNAEDNATLLLRFARAVGTIEASWTSFHNGVANGPIVMGTHGTLVIDGGDVLVFTERGSAVPSRVEQGEALPVGRANIGEAMLHHIETGAALHPTLDVSLNRQAVAILDAGRRAADGGMGVAP